MKKLLPFILLMTCVFLLTTCEDRERSNPVDPNVDPDAWAPSNLQAEVINDSQIKLTWTQEVEQISGFRIERKADSGSFSQIAEVDADGTEYTDTGLNYGTDYTYRVKAFTDDNESDYTETTVNFWQDCNADWGGSAYENECGCVGGNTGLEEDFCYGCTDSDADNYDPYAIIDDGSCIYTVTDIDGNVYQAVYIGDKLWMTENLKVTHYQNGEAISYITNNVGWATATSGAYCVYDNNQTNAETYGYLYNGYAVEDSRNIAPEGWHVPQDWEWQVSVNYLGGDLVAGGKLKEVGTEHWQSPNTGATNESGFTGLPGGERWPVSGDFHSITYIGGFWTSSTSISEDLLWTWYLGYNYSDAYRIDSGKWSGYSVRCVKD